jgi:hypothetical protein
VSLDGEFGRRGIEFSWLTREPFDPLDQGLLVNKGSPAGSVRLSASLARPDRGMDRPFWPVRPFTVVLTYMLLSLYPRVVVGTEQGVQGPLPDAEDGTNGAPMSQVFDLPSDEAVASLPSSTQEVRPLFGCTVHDTEWIEDDEECKLPINGPVRPLQWRIKDFLGNIYHKDCDPNGRDRISYLMLMWPKDAIAHMVDETNFMLLTDGKEPTTQGEMIKFFGLVILATRFEFSSRASLWSRESFGRFHSAPAFGRSGMSRNRFDHIWQHLRFSAQPIVRPPSMSHEEYRWMLVGDFVAFFNDARAKEFHPSDRICVDESISRWYGMGGDWINNGLPMYVAMDRKPENGCEIQNSCCAESGVMIRMRVRKTQACDSVEHDPDKEKGTSILRELVLPWSRTSRVVCADSFFASVEAARELFKIGLRFIGVIKTSHRLFPLAHLGTVQFNGDSVRGQWKGLIHKKTDDALPDILAFIWVDTNRRCFVSTVSSLEDAPPIRRIRLRQVNTALNAEPERVFMSIKQPKASAVYYTSAAKIDQHNRTRQDDLAIERKLGTHDWSKRVNLSVFSMIVVDAYLVYKACTGSVESPSVFFHRLAEDMIDYEAVTRAERAAIAEAFRDIDIRRVSTDFGPRQTPTKRVLRSNGKVTKIKVQGKCKCKMKTTWTCSACADQGREIWCCHKKDRDACWPAHWQEFHE